MQGPDAMDARRGRGRPPLDAAGVRRLTVSLPEPLAELVEELAAATGESMSAVIREMVATGVQDSELQTSR